MQGIGPIAMQYANAAMTSSLSVRILNTEHSIIVSQTEIFKLYVFKKHLFLHLFTKHAEISLMLQEWK